jgi:biotin synthase
MAKLNDTLNKTDFTVEDIIFLLSLNDEADIDILFQKALEVKTKYVGRIVYYRGLIEYSNICKKNCYYCGIRADSKAVSRYSMNEEEVIKAAIDAYKYNYGSIVIQSGERDDNDFVDTINRMLKTIKTQTDGKLGITLSVGEHSQEAYSDFFKNGAHRFLLRIETTNKELYAKLHPKDHYYEKRIQCLKRLQRAGYQTGTGVMIGLPFQTMEDLANDLLFFKEMDIDMVGMGPYIEHESTPLFEYSEGLMTKKERFNLALRMIAVLRIMMKDINIAAATALQAIDPIGREKALKVGANVIMPNLTPTKYRPDYTLYEDKPCLDEDAEKCRGCLDARITGAGDKIGYGQWGDSKHFASRQQAAGLA